MGIGGGGVGGCGYGVGVVCMVGIIWYLSLYGVRCLHADADVGARAALSVCVVYVPVRALRPEADELACSGSLPEGRIRVLFSQRLHYGVITSVALPVPHYTSISLLFVSCFTTLLPPSSLARKSSFAFAGGKKCRTSIVSSPIPALAGTQTYTYCT